MNTSNTSVVGNLRSRFRVRFGVNKTEELCRLIYEVGKRENVDVETVLDETLSFLKRTDAPDEQPSFSNMKRVLLKRRFPNLPAADLRRVHLSPLKATDQQPEPRADGTAFRPDLIWLERSARDSSLAVRAKKIWPDAPVVSIESLTELKRPKQTWIKDFGKSAIAIVNERFDFIKPCPCTSGACSCNYYVLNLGYGCPFDCSYCYLQHYQNLPAIVLPANLGDYLAELDGVFHESPKRFLRIGTGEFTDSLALDWLTEYSKILVPYFRNKPVLFELKTKSDFVDNLLGLDHGGRTVVAWSVNPSCLATEEKRAAPIACRIAAAKRCETAGYGTAFHFDPMVTMPNWENHYRELIDQIFSSVHASVRWISLGTLRYYRELRSVAETRHPESLLFLGESRLDAMDDKVRYRTEERVSMYRKMIEWIRSRHGSVPIYLCMESPEVWQAVYGSRPYEGRIDKWISGMPSRESQALECAR
jgi:spore photoproduct lyase